jgi:7,8-dihydropterin-6-yl-methyl-4-(beta-D-ribofuranosyl)aminobenzene 5'-phosphate synthase
MRVTCVVDDRGQPGSGLMSEHGASFLIEAGGQTALFDTGPSGSVLIHNLAALGIVPQEIETLILSHAHDDHTGGLAGLLELVPGLPLYAHPDFLRKRYRKADTGPRLVGPGIGRAALARRAVLRLSAEPVEVLPGVWTSGEIAPRPEPEGRSASHLVRHLSGWIADPYRDDLSVVLKTAQGLVLVCGCCHAGLLNTLARVRSTFDGDPVAVVGGMHLIHADAPTMAHVVEQLKGYGPPRLWIGHCTGDRAFLAFKAAFGDLVSLCPVGTLLEF